MYYIGLTNDNKDKTECIYPFFFQMGMHIGNYNEYKDQECSNDNGRTDGHDENNK